MQALLLDLDGVLADGADGPPLVRAATLEALAARYRLALVTARPEGAARRALARLDRGGLIGVVVGGERRPGGDAPDPHGLTLALGALGVAPAAAVRAAPAPADVRAAVAAGVRAVGVVPPRAPYAPHARALLDAGAEAVVSRAEDLALLLPVLYGRR